METSPTPTQNSTVKSTSQLKQLSKLTTVVADTGDFANLRHYRPQDATTNPTLIYQAVQMDRYMHLLEKAVADCEGKDEHGEVLVADILDHLLVAFGREILEIIPGRVSTEVDARLSFDVEGTIARARRIVQLYTEAGIARERVLIKIASTWEGIQAARTLEAEGIHCNMTLLFGLPQAIACAEAGVTLISPFVGRITDWYQEKTGHSYTAEDDPGVQSVRSIYTYFKHFGYQTEVMGASFRNTGQVLALAGCDLLTISPKLLEELASTDAPVTRRLDPEEAARQPQNRLELDEKAFRWHLNADPMATTKLADGIRRFATDTEKLEALIEAESLER